MNSCLTVETIQTCLFNSKYVDERRCPILPAGVTSWSRLHPSPVGLAGLPPAHPAGTRQPRCTRVFPVGPAELLDHIQNGSNGAFLAQANQLCKQQSGISPRAKSAVKPALAWVINHFRERTFWKKMSGREEKKNGS